MSCELSTRDIQCKGMTSSGFFAEVIDLPHHGSSLVSRIGRAIYEITLCAAPSMLGVLRTVSTVTEHRTKAQDSLRY